MTESKYPSHQEENKLQEKEAREGVALGLEISACQIYGNGVTLCPALEENHLGDTSIYRPRKVFGQKSQSTGKNHQQSRLALGFEKSISQI